MSKSDEYCFPLYLVVQRRTLLLKLRLLERRISSASGSFSIGAKTFTIYVLILRSPKACDLSKILPTILLLLAIHKHQVVSQGIGMNIILKPPSIVPIPQTIR